MWIVEREHKRDEDGENVAVELRDPDGWMRAHVRWDGGIQVWIDTVTEEQNEIHDTFHTYDIRGFIDKLQDLQTASEELFNHQGYWASNCVESEDNLSYIPDRTSRGGATPPP